MAIAKRACASLTEDMTKTLSEHVFEEIARIRMRTRAWENDIELV